MSATHTHKNNAADSTMTRLLECRADLKCINSCLRRCGSFPMTLEEIGLILGITRERVRQIETTAIKKLKHPKYARVLREYLYGG